MRSLKYYCARDKHKKLHVYFCIFIRPLTLARLTNFLFNWNELFKCVFCVVSGVVGLVKLSFWRRAFQGGRCHQKRWKFIGMRRFGKQSPRATQKCLKIKSNNFSCLSSVSFDQSWHIFLTINTKTFIIPNAPPLNGLTNWPKLFARCIFDCLCWKSTVCGGECVCAICKSAIFSRPKPFQLPAGDFLFAAFFHCYM